MRNRKKPNPRPSLQVMIMAANQRFFNQRQFKICLTYLIKMGSAPDGPAQVPTALTFEAFYIF